jgi:hypothetical protein
MSRPEPGPCIHCLQSSDALTWDHVIPSAWYPDSTPQDLEKWKIPSCVGCNSRYGSIENEILLRLGLCLSPEDAQAAGIAMKALRAIKPEFAKNEKDRRAREAKRQQIREEMFVVTNEHEGFFPGFGLRDMPASRLAVPVPQDILLAFGVKLARGLTYLETRKVIPSNYRVQVNFVHDHDLGDVNDLLKRYGKSSFRGPGVQVERAALPGDPSSSVSRVTMWGRYKSYVCVFPETLAPQQANSAAT